MNHFPVRMLSNQNQIYLWERVSFNKVLNFKSLAKGSEIVRSPVSTFTKWMKFCFDLNLKYHKPNCPPWPNSHLLIGSGRIEPSCTSPPGQQAGMIQKPLRRLLNWPFLHPHPLSQHWHCQEGKGDRGSSTKLLAGLCCLAGAGGGRWNGSPLPWVFISQMHAYSWH